MEKLRERGGDRVRRNGRTEMEEMRRKGHIGSERRQNRVLGRNRKPQEAIENSEDGRGRGLIKGMGGAEEGEEEM